VRSEKAVLTSQVLENKGNAVCQDSQDNGFSEKCCPGRVKSSMKSMVRYVRTMRSPLKGASGAPDCAAALRGHGLSRVADPEKQMRRAGLFGAGLKTPTGDFLENV